MALQGISLVSSLAWITGVIFLDKPWGRPTFKKWCSLPLFIFIFNYTVYGFILLDSLLNFPEQLNRFNDPKATPSRLIRGISSIAYYEFVASNTIINLIFKIKAKQLAKLWGELYTRNHEDSVLKVYSTNIIGLFVGSGTFLVMIAIIGVEGKDIGTYYQKSWIGGMGQIPFTILTVWFLLPPLIVPLASGFTASVATFYHLGKVYERHCQRIRDLMESLSRNAKNEEKPSRPEMIALKEVLYQEFLWVQELFALSDSIIGPIILVVLSGGTLRLVMLCAKFVFHHQEIRKTIGVDQRMYVDAAHLLVVLGQMYTLELGQALKKEFAKWKEVLRDKALDLPITTSYDAQDARDLFLMVDNWDWHLSAWGFFDVDRKLMSGVISLILTYTVILVQVRLAVEGSSG